MNNWKLTTSIGLIFIVFSITFFLVLGFNEESLMLMLRISARTAIIIFLFAFLASTLVKIKSTNFTRWLLKNRRYIGVSFALVHTIHLGFIFMRHFIYESSLFQDSMKSLLCLCFAFQREQLLLYSYLLFQHPLQ